MQAAQQSVRSENLFRITPHTSFRGNALTKRNQETMFIISHFSHFVPMES